MSRRGQRGSQNTYCVCKILGLFKQKNCLKILTLCRRHAYFEVARQLLSFIIVLALGVKHDLFLVLRSDIVAYIIGLFYRHALKYLEPTRSAKKEAETLFPTQTPHFSSGFFQGPWSVGSRENNFAASGSPINITSTEHRLCHPFPLSMEVIMIQSMYQLRRYCKRHSCVSYLKTSVVQPESDHEPI